MKDLFSKFSRASAGALGSPWAFLAAAAFIVIWAVTGPMFGYSENWQLIANTVTNVITFLMVFIIQATQNRDTLATQLKLDELIRALDGARTSLVNLESLSDEDLAQLEGEFERLRLRERRREGAPAGGRAGGQAGSRSGPTGAKPASAR